MVQPASLVPRVQVFVCVNAREAGDPLASGCGATGPTVYARCKERVVREAAGRNVWVTRTLCLGQCPRSGCAVVVYPSGRHYVSVTADDVTALMDEALGSR